MADPPCDTDGYDLVMATCHWDRPSAQNRKTAAG